MHEEDHEELVGQVLAQKLKVLRLIGAGGMGAVYEVEHLITRHRRALKVLHPSFIGSEAAVTRFLREAGVAGTLDTPHVVETLDAGRLEDGSPYLVMELLKGLPLSELLKNEAPLAPVRAIELLLQACVGIAAAHDEGIIHRDLKPDNLFVSKRGEREELKILDFGISKFTKPFDEIENLTNTGAILGTPYYLSPEQARGKKVDQRTDIYALGVILYECLSGRRCFRAKSMTELIVKIHEGAFIPLSNVLPGIDSELEAVIHRAMAVDRDDRFNDARRLADALREIAERGVEAVEPAPKGLELAPRISDPPISQNATSPEKPIAASQAPTDEREDELSSLTPAERADTRPADSNGHAAAPAATTSAPRAASSSRGGIAIASIVAALAAAGIAIAVMASEPPEQQSSPPVEAAISTPEDRAEEPTSEVEIPVETDSEEILQSEDASAATPAPTAMRSTMASSTARGPGVLSIQTHPASEVFVDGQRRGHTPLRAELSPGTHQVRVTYPNGNQELHPVQIRANETTRVSWRQQP